MPPTHCTGRGRGVNPGGGRDLNPSTQNPSPQSRYFPGLFIALPHLSLFY